MAARLKIAFQGGARSLKGMDRLVAKLSAYPDAALSLLKAELERSADELVDNIKAITPVSPTGYEGRPPGELRDSVHKEPGRHPLAVSVVEDAQDGHGNFYGPHVEFGHKTVSGSHVEAQPAFFPSVRVARKKMRNRLSRAMTKAIKQTVGAGPSA